MKPQKYKDNPRLGRIRNFFVEQHYRFLLGIQFLTFINFALLIIAASDKLQLIIHLSTKAIVLFSIPIAFIGMWCFGYFMDTIVKFPQQQARVQTERTPVWKETHEKLDEILTIIKK